LFKPNSSFYHPNGGIQICPDLPSPIPEKRYPTKKIIGEQFIGKREFVEYFLEPRKRLKNGCYLVRLEPFWRVNYDNYHWDGTIRVTSKMIRYTLYSKTVSGDLYLHDPDEPSMDFEEPDPSEGIPIFPIPAYDYYLEIINLEEKSSEVEMTFKKWHFNHNNKTWNNAGTFSAIMKWRTAPPGYPDPDYYLEGDVFDSNDIKTATLKMGWISNFIRKATIEIDRESVSEAPLDNGDSIDWTSILTKVGWDITVIEDDATVTAPTPTDWNETELHQEMLNWRDTVDLNTEWRYHLLCVQEHELDILGVMYDNGGTDSNDVPREGAALFSHPVLPNQARFGTCQGLRYGTCTGPYFRSAIHEIGHAMLQYHPSVTDDNYIMQQTGQITTNSTATTVFPDNIIYNFNLDNTRKLRHLPDMAVRPGGIPFAYTGLIPQSSGTLVTLPIYFNFLVMPRLVVIPLGAPVRVDLSIQNLSKETKLLPSMSMKKGHIHGEVIDPAGNIRIFSTIIRHITPNDLEEIKPNEIKTHALTLLRGKQGALFPISGMYKITVYLNWRETKKCKRLIGETKVFVAPPINSKHAEIACKLLSTPNTLLSLVFGGDNIKDGLEAIQLGLKHKTLRPHYAYIEAKRLVSKYKDRQPNLEAVSALLKDAIMTKAEVRSISKKINKISKKASKVQVRKIKKVLFLKMKY